MPVSTAPSGLAVAAAGPDALNVTWTDNSDDEDNFEVERAFSAGGTWAQVSDSAANATAYLDTGLAPTMFYYYRVRAVNGSGNSAYTSIVGSRTANLPAIPPRQGRRGRGGR